MKPLNYPVLFVHGMGFHDSNADIETNGLHIANKIDGILKESGAEKINIIAHSKGGLDCRYAISALGKADHFVFSTYCSVHFGRKK